MKPRSNRILRWVIILSSSLLLIVAITYFLTVYVEREVRETINLHQGQVSSIDVNLFTRSLEITNLEWSSGKDSLNSIPDFLHVNNLSVTGISLYELLVNKIIHVDQLTLDSGKFRYTTNVKPVARELTTYRYKAIHCTSISLNTIETEIIADTVVAFAALLNLHLTDATVRVDSANALEYLLKNSDGTVNNINFSRHEGMYGGTIKQLSFNIQDQTITIDSVLLIPNFSKYKFARYLGEQAGRINISIPKLTLEGVVFDKLIDSAFIVSKIVIQSFDLYSFKDKRIPFLNEDNIHLPMEDFLNLRWKVKIDSFLISNSRITIEEFPEKGVEAGILTINDVNAAFTGLNNRKTKMDPSYAVLTATALFMNSGKLKASFQFPLDGSSSYHANGSISKMLFAEFNPVLTKLANLRVKSGYLNSLVFDFTYTELTSKGSLDIDYADLRITSLNKNKQTTNDLRTLFVNAVVRNNRDQSGPSAKAAGVINIERNRKKLIFNVWKMSILDGLRSSILGRKKAEGASKKS